MNETRMMKNCNGGQSSVSEFKRLKRKLERERESNKQQHTSK